MSEADLFYVEISKDSTQTKLYFLIGIHILPSTRKNYAFAFSFSMDEILLIRELITDNSIGYPIRIYDRWTPGLNANKKR